MTALVSPRIAPLSVDRWTEAGRDLMRGHLPAADQYLSGDPAAPALPNILGVLGHNPNLAGTWLAFNATLLQSGHVPPPDRELLILRVAWRTQSAYEWDQHVRIAATTGVTPEQIAAVTDIEARIWTLPHRDLMAAADQLVRDHRVDDATWTRLAATYDNTQLLELLFIVGAYVCLAMFANSVDLQTDPIRAGDTRIELPALEA